MWAISHFHTLYGNCVTVYTDHSAVKAVLQTPNPTGKHARWWTKVYCSGVKEVHIIYRSGKTNLSADPLLQSPQSPHAPAPAGNINDDNEIQVAVMTSHSDKEISIQSLFQLEPEPNQPNESESFASKQRKDPNLRETIHFLKRGELPQDPNRARKIAVFTVVDDILFFLDPKNKHQRRVVVPEHICKRVMEENHGGTMGGHFSGNQLYNTLARQW